LKGIEPNDHAARDRCIARRVRGYTTEMDLPPDPFVLRRARQRLREVAADSLPPNRLFALQLCTCDVLANALRLGFSIHEPVDVEAERDKGAVRVTVAQRDGHGGPPSNRFECLPMADGLADRWAIESESPIRLWFEMDLDPAKPAAASRTGIQPKRRIDVAS
jgi:hypothetical protein